MAGKGFGFLFEMGCGKTLTAIMTVGTLYNCKKINKLLIAAPTSVCSVWTKEFDDYANFKAIVKVLLGTKEQRLKALNDLNSAPVDGLKVAVVNYEGAWREGIFETLENWQPDMIICDESQRIKTHNAKQSKAMHKLGDIAKYKLILSGTPVQNNAIDLYSQYRFLDPNVFGDNFYAFRNRYAIMGGFNQRQIIGYRDLDELIQKEYSVAYRVTKADALDLPEQVFEQRFIELTPKERSLYNQIKRNSFAELENGGQITATTALTRILRLQQFTGGFIVPDESTKPELISKSKLEALEDIIEDYCISAGKKLVVFARFRTEIELIENMLKNKKIKYGLIYGDIKLEHRGNIVKDFQENPNTLVFLAQIDTAGLGITLTAADACVYYSVNFNYAAYSQSLARIHRIGQRNSCTYIHLIAKNTIDEMILKALAKKEDLAKNIVDNWKQYFE
ncbi:MAG: DEAD/DEAH box helicase [Lachnospirales bacterium]